MFHTTRAAVIGLSALSLTLGSPTVASDPFTESTTAGATPVTQAGSIVPAAESTTLPAVKSQLVFPEASPTLEELVHKFEEAVGCSVLKTEETCTMVSSQRARIPKDLVVPSSEVYEFFEYHMVRHGYHMTFLKGGAVPLFGIDSEHRSSFISASAIEIRPDEAALYRKHPALLVQTTLSLDKVDTRAASSTMRILITNSNIMSLIPIGSNSIYVKGPGAFVYNVVRALQLSDSAEPDPEPSTPGPAGMGGR